MFGLSGAAVAGIAGTVGGALISSKGAKDAAKIAAQGGQLDPRIASLIFGENGQPGLIGEYRELGKTPRSDAALGFAGANEQYLTNNGGADLGAIRQTALGAMGGNSAPMMTAAQAPTALAGAASASLPSYAVGNMVDAPVQNRMDLSGSYDSLINGPAGANPYLTGGIQKGINQSANAFGNMITDAKAATQDVLGNIRSNAVLAGQYGGSRQGIAEGRAIDSMNTNLARAAAQFGQNNTDAAVAAQAGAYDTDRNRQLAATQGLSAQQYGVAQQNAATKNAAEFMNVGNQFDASKINAGFQQQTNLANLGSQQAMNLAGLGAQQQTNLANQQSQLTTNAQNNSAGLGGAGLLSGLLSQVGGAVGANDNWDITRAGQINSLLAPLIGASPTQNPVASNSGAAALGGGMAGLSLGNSLAGLFGQNSSLPSLQTNHAQPITAFAPQNQPINLPFMSRI